MEFECVLSISVSDLTLEALGQIDDFDCSVRTSFDTHAATNAEVFRNLAYSRCFTDLDAEFTSFVDRARFLALLCTFFRFTFIRVYDSYSKLIVSSSLHARCSLILFGSFSSIKKQCDKY